MRLRDDGSAAGGYRFDPRCDSHDVARVILDARRRQRRRRECRMRAFNTGVLSVRAPTKRVSAGQPDGLDPK